MASAQSALWTARPQPFPDESFASWFLRLSQANGLTPAELYRVAVPGAYLHGRDLDRVACPDLLRVLAQRTGVPLETLLGLTFARWCGTVFDEDDGRNKLAWLPPAGREKSRKSFGQQYCPHCLAEDATPYLRAAWRLGFVSICADHRTVLCDRCPGCAEPVQPLKLVRKGRIFACPKCGADLARAKPAGSLHEDLRFQEIMIRAASAGWVDLPGWGSLYGLSFFRLASVIFRLLVTGTFARPLRHYLARSLAEGYEMAQIPLVKEVELLPPERRVQLLRLVGRLLSDWPSGFIESCKKVGASPRHLIKDASLVPFVFWEPVIRELSGALRQVSDAEMREGTDYLRRHGVPPTQEALISLFKVKAASIQQHAEPAFPHEPYGKGRYWKLDNVSPEVRQAVRLTAHMEGENISGWVEKALREKLRTSGFVIPSHLSP